MGVEGEYRPGGEQFAEGSVPEQSGVSPFDTFVESLVALERGQQESQTRKETLADETRYIQACLGHKSEYPLRHDLNQADKTDDTFAKLQYFYSMYVTDEMSPDDGRIETKQQLGEVTATYAVLAFDQFSPKVQTELRTAIDRVEETGCIQLSDTTLPATLKPLFSLPTEELVGSLSDQQKDLLAYMLDHADLPYEVTGKNVPTREEIEEAKQQYERDYEQWQAELRGDQKGERAADPFFFMDKINRRFEGFPIYEDIGFEPTEEQNEMIKCNSRLSSRQDSGLKSGRDKRPQARSEAEETGSPDLAGVNATGSFPRMRYELPRK